MVLKPLQPFILYKRTKGEMRSQAQFTGELFPKIILACIKIWLGIPSFLQLMGELHVLQLLPRYPCWAFISRHDEVTCWTQNGITVELLFGKLFGIRYTRQKMFCGCVTLVLFAEVHCLWCKMRLSQRAGVKWQSCEAAIKAQLRCHAFILHPVVQAAVRLVLQKKQFVLDFSEWEWWKAELLR